MHNMTIILSLYFTFLKDYISKKVSFLKKINANILSHTEKKLFSVKDQNIWKVTNYLNKRGKECRLKTSFSCKHKSG